MASSKIFSDFAAKKITADEGSVHKLMYNARVWRRLRALKSYSELGLTNQCFFKRGYFYKLLYKLLSLGSSIYGTSRAK